jgi:quinoprotein glucose dehydrogenase
MGIDDPGPVGSIGFVFPLVTKSLLFIAVGDGQGTNQLRVLDKKTGETIHVVELPGYPSGAPMTYMVDGKQYISLALGMAKNAKLVTLALP